MNLLIGVVIGLSIVVGFLTWTLGSLVIRVESLERRAARQERP